jgi:ATP-dependent RNA helicase SUPV3L1/SUV3
VATYERLSPLTVEDHPLRTLSAVRKGDCVVAFSRKEIYHIKAEIER